MKILVAGAEGQVAQSLKERAAGRADLGLVLLGRPDLDLGKPGSAQSAVATIRPDAVINAAAYTAVDQAENEPDLAFRINADGAGELAAAAALAGARIVHVSTDYVFDGRASHPYSEDTPTNPLGVYGRSKLAGEKQVRTANPNHAIVRTAWLYGPFGHNFLKSMLAAAERRSQLSVVDDQIGSPTSTLDLADALLAAATGGATGTFHYAAAGSTSWCGFARFITAERARHGFGGVEVIPISTGDWPAKAERPAFSVLDSSKFSEAFDVRPHPWEEGACEVIARLLRS